VAEPGREPTWLSGRSRAPGRWRRRYAYLFGGFVIGIVVGLAFALLIDTWSRSWQPPDPRQFLVTRLHAVSLSNGRVIVGRIDHLAAPFLVISEAVTVQPKVDDVSKEVQWSVPPRGGDWHQPGLVIVGAQQVVSVDAIKPGSPLAAAVDQARARP
jgi:hypothetical protein